MPDEPVQLFGVMIPAQTEAGTVEYQELYEAGLSITDHKPVYIMVCFQGEMLGIQTPPGATVEHKVLMTADNAALLAAILIGHGERAAGRIPFTAMLDQQTAFVRQKIKNGEPT